MKLKGFNKQILVEREDDIHFLHENVQNDNVEWFTTSPWIIEKMSLKGEKVHCLENYIQIDKLNKIRHLAYIVGQLVKNHIDNMSNLFPIKIKIGECLFENIQNTFFILCYKAWLLRRWINEDYGNNKIILGSPKLTQVKFYDISIGRFDTLFAAIASEAKKNGWNGCEVICCESNKNGEENIRKMKLVGQSNKERLMSILNMPAHTISYKILKKLNFKNICLRLKNNKTIFIILKECELLEETVPYLIALGYQIIFDKLNWLYKDLLPTKLDISYKMFTKPILEKCIKIYRQYDISFDHLQKAVLNILLKRIYQALTYVNPLLKRISKYKDKLDKIMIKNDKQQIAFLTNGLTLPAERLFYQYIKIMKIPVFEFEHGITEGLSHFSKYRNLYRNYANDYLICFAHRVFDYKSNEYNIKKGGIVSGAPKTLKNIKAPFIQKIIGQRLFDLKNCKRLITYLAQCTRNNLFYGPFGQNDLEYYKITRKIIYDIFLKIKSNNYLIKLYPSNRYIDPDPFAKLLKYPKNIKVIQYLEFRYIRPIIDVIILDNPQSTLGWAWSARVPLIYLDLPSNPLLPHVADAFDKAIFRIDCSKEGWVEQVRELLLLNHNELLKLWKEKEPIRKKVEEKYIFGPPGNTGKRAAKFIIEETKKWYQKHNIN